MFGDENDGKNPREEKEEAKIASYPALTKLARCWEGYEPVPGKKPYSEDSCRPKKGKKKKKPAAKTAAYPGGFQKDAVYGALGGMGIGGLINFLRGRSILRGVTTGGLTGAGADLGSLVGHDIGTIASGDPTSNVTAFGTTGGGAAGGIGGYMLAQKLHDAISEDKDQDKINEMLAQYKQGSALPPMLKQNMAMYPALTKQAFEMPEGISDAWSGIKDYFSNNPDAMNALIGGGAGLLGGGLLGYLKSDKNESSADDIFGHALLGGGAGAGLGYGANRIGSMVADSDWYKNMRNNMGDDLVQGYVGDLPGRIFEGAKDYGSSAWNKAKDFFGYGGANPAGLPSLNPANDILQKIEPTTLPNVTRA